MELGTAFDCCYLEWTPIFGTNFSSVKWGDIPELGRRRVYHNNPLGEGLLSLPQETSGIVPNLDKCPLALLRSLS